MSEIKPPTAKRIPHPHTAHGDTRPDDYYWLNERENPEVIAYLEAENAYLEAVMGPLEPFREQLYREMLGRIQQTDLEVPVQHGPYFYYARTEEGKQYRIHCRKKAASRAELEAAPEEVILDLGALAEGKSYLSVSVLKPSPDHRLLAYLQNEDGSDRYTLYVKDLQTGELLPDRVEDVYLHQSLEWDATGEYLFFTRVDETQRPCYLYRHRLGHSEPTLLYQEPDETFRLKLYKSASGRFLFAASTSTLTDEVRYLEALQPEGKWHVFTPRQRGVKYSLEHQGQHFLLLTNQDALNFKLLSAPVLSPSPDHWHELLPHDPEVYLQGVLPFERHLLVYGRQGGSTQLWVWDLIHGTYRRLEWPEPVYTVAPADNREYATDRALVSFQSLLTPRKVLELDLNTLETTLLKQDEVLGGYDPAEYVQERLWATARDGVQVPISLVYKRSTPRPAPLYLYAYGSYGISIDPAFSPTRLVLLERGVVFAIAHIRGGAEMGRGWYEDGKLLKKKNTFTDFIDCAMHLVEEGYTTPERLMAVGGSAGGLLMGAVINLRPDLFRAVAAHVPFVDVVTTMSDPSIPLTTLEYDEWGNPADPEFYAYMKSYSPYDNVEAKAYPHLLVTAGINDPRVGYWEPAKWVARLRALKTDANTLLLKTHMGAGHGGSSGRYDRLKEVALEYAFLLDKVGLRD
ncbi:Oligopeptidase B [Allomeiothermus silvanus DSM 9946]|uniref:Oligopeptidase B n=1 Tax=Allomeiothermus silvanus (strain ATCC 700542 / DSM 9946 / NBRC 106475 / NCIMB 13440 / VI-R2) TaxID=526227 RepID=D7BG56_ALLS1|nr:S9 family peptidase [Allomeiothermus silvanus]ADH61977.1 Oligopeptidase B [Allomeiothermus silvanus DSM 9946]